MNRKRKLDIQWLICCVLSLITFAVYLPVVHHSFVEYDDQQYVTENPVVQAGLTWHGLIWAFGFHAGNWHPLTWLSHMMDCQIYGVWAGGHHLTNVLLHIANTVFLFLVLNRMTGFVWRSAAVAAIFAWHPLHVESVAWIAERKDVLCAFFWMLTLFLYVRYAAKPSIARYLSAFGSFILCLMAKPMAVTLPFVLLLLDYWPLNRISELVSYQPEKILPRFPQKSWRQLIIEKIPFLLLTIAGCGLTLAAQQLAIASTVGLPILQRLAHSLIAYNHYLLALFIPINLAVYYPYQIQISRLTVAFSVIIPGLVTFLGIKNYQRRPYILVGWLWYLGTLIPVIGLVQVGDQAWADRYTYLPSIGLFILLIWFLCGVIKNRIMLQSIFVIVTILLITTTSIQLGYWKNTRTLFEHTEKVTQNNYMAITVLGSLLAQEHKLDEAMEYYQKALSYQPDFPKAHFFLGNALAEQDKLDEAIAEYQKALWFRPIEEQTHIFIGMALAKQKKYDEAIAHYNAALKLNPDSAIAQNNLGRIFHMQGKYDLAVKHYNAALAIDPKLAVAYNNLGILLLQHGDSTNGIHQLREGLKLNPTNSETEFNLAFALNQQKQWPEAAVLFSKVVPDDLPDSKAHYEFAVALTHLQETREAMSQYASALLIQPDFPDALDGLAWILSTDPNPKFRNGTEAVKMATQACELTGGNDPVKLKTLAAAYAETSHFDQAINTIQTAKNLADQAGPPEISNECQIMLRNFQQSKPWRGL
jgi:tetratricopeptide (TPR) repeat protein